MIEITDQEFRHFQEFIYEAAGITLPPSKRTLVCGRLAKRLQHCQVRNYGEYFSILSSGHAPDEVQVAVDLLTTNETYFFREPRHFDLLRAAALQARGRSEPFRVWSAASSTGEEAFSAAMVLADCLGTAAWEVVGTDISMRVLQAACRGLYPMERARHIPDAYLRRYCLKGMDEHEGKLLVERSLRSRVHFRHANLNEPLPEMGPFDVVFLRNVMIYFGDETKRQVAGRVLAQLRHGGHLFIGHSESLNGINDSVSMTEPSVYRKP